MIGFLTALDGEPLAVTGFKGHTSDPRTGRGADRAGKGPVQDHQGGLCGGSRHGASQRPDGATDQGLQYITALTDPQMRKLLKQDVLPLNLFDETAQEVEHGNR